jgi:DNA-binding MarR family transcriptional regulator
MSDNHEENREKHHHDNHHEDHHHEDYHHEDHHHEDHHHEEHHEDHHHEDHHHEDHHKDRHMRHCHDENHRGEHERHCNHEMAISDNKEDNLLTLLGKCGHFMHHKRGGKRGQGKILTILAEHPEINQKDLQEMLGVESGSMSEIVIKLENKGLITRCKDETDKRMTKLMITELGSELSKEVESRDTEEDKFLFGSLTEEEQEQLKILLKKMLQGWEANYEVIRESRHCHAEGEEHCHKGGRRHHKYHLHSDI